VQKNSYDVRQVSKNWVLVAGSRTSFIVFTLTSHQTIFDKFQQVLAICQKK